MDVLTAPIPQAVQPATTLIDPGEVALGDFIVTPAGDVADVRTRDVGYSWVILGARDRTGRTDEWAYALGDKVELLAAGPERAA